MRAVAPAVDITQSNKETTLKVFWMGHRARQGSCSGVVLGLQAPLKSILWRAGPQPAMAKRDTGQPPPLAGQ